MKKIFALLIASLLCISFCSGCGTDPSKVVKVYNASEYIAEGVIEEFEAETGYKVSIVNSLPTKICIPKSKQQLTMF